MKMKLKSTLRVACQSVAAAVFAGAVLLITSGAPAQNLFVANQGGTSGTTITEITPGGAQSRFASGLSSPDGLAFNSAGDLFVANQEGDTITEITPGGVRSTFASGLQVPCGLAFNSAGNLFVANFSEGTIYEYTPGGVQSTFASGLDGPEGLAFNSAGDLFESDSYSGNIYEFTPAGTKSTFASGFQTPLTLAFDQAGNLFVANTVSFSPNNTGSIIEITTGGVRLTFASGLDPVGLAFNGAGDLFESDWDTGKIYEFTPGGAQSTFATGLNYPEGLAFQPVPELVADVTNGVFQATVSMPSPSHPTIIQASTDMVNWTRVYTNTPPFTFTDSMETTLPHRFYRALLAP